MEMMVIDRANKGVAKAEVTRHLKSCKTYSKQHGKPCFLISIAILPNELKKTKGVSISKGFGAGVTPEDTINCQDCVDMIIHRD